MAKLTDVQISRTPPKGRVHGHRVKMPGASIPPLSAVASPNQDGNQQSAIGQRRILCRVTRRAEPFVVADELQHGSVEMQRVHVQCDERQDCNAVALQFQRM